MHLFVSLSMHAVSPLNETKSLCVHRSKGCAIRREAQYSWTVCLFAVVGCPGLSSYIFRHFLVVVDRDGNALREQAVQDCPCEVATSSLNDTHVCKFGPIGRRFTKPYPLLRWMSARQPQRDVLLSSAQQYTRKLALFVGLRHSHSTSSSVGSFPGFGNYQVVIRTYQHLGLTKPLGPYE